MPQTIRQHILNEISDVVSRLLYYDRREDEDLPLGAIDDAVAAGVVSEEEIVAAFAAALRRGLA